STLPDMNGYLFAYSSAPLRRVKYVQFGVLSPDEIVSFLLPLTKERH
ncbi:354_t:CDS:1, partial [Ambispora leptoticha]